MALCDDDEPMARMAAAVHGGGGGRPRRRPWAADPSARLKQRQDLPRGGADAGAHQPAEQAGRVVRPARQPRPAVPVHAGQRRRLGRASDRERARSGRARISSSWPGSIPASRRTCRRRWATWRRPASPTRSTPTSGTSATPPPTRCWSSSTGSTRLSALRRDVAHPDRPDGNLDRRQGQRPLARDGQMPRGLGPDLRQRRPRVPAGAGLGQSLRPAGPAAFDASWNRHVGQRNIHVNAPGQNLAGAPCAWPRRAWRMTQPILIKVGALYGAPATVGGGAGGAERRPLAAAAHRPARRLSGHGAAHRNADPLAADDGGRRAIRRDRGGGQPHRARR